MLFYAYKVNFPEKNGNIIFFSPCLNFFLEVLI